MQLRTKIKICGITEKTDAIDASELGVDALGFVFYKPSSRYIDPENAGKIIDALDPFLTRVGLFVDASAEEINLAIRKSKVNCLQFHGDETEGFCNQFGLPYIKSIAMRDGVVLIENCDIYSTASALLLDTYSDKLKGGTGQKFDWRKIPEKLPLPIIVAGGLNNNNVSNLINTVNPYGVDISGGVEIKKGKKDYAMMRDFILGVNNAIV